jgi:hypothetical protein
MSHFPSSPHSIHLLSNQLLSFPCFLFRVLIHPAGVHVPAPLARALATAAPPSSAQSAPPSSATSAGGKNKHKEPTIPPLAPLPGVTRLMPPAAAAAEGASAHVTALTAASQWAYTPAPVPPTPKELQETVQVCFSYVYIYSVFVLH